MREEQLELDLSGESTYFNEKFPKAGKWPGVLVREKNPNDLVPKLESPERIFEVVVPQEVGQNLFICYYKYGDMESRERAERLLKSIYPLFTEETELGTSHPL